MDKHGATEQNMKPRPSTEWAPQEDKDRPEPAPAPHNHEPSDGNPH